MKLKGGINFRDLGGHLTSDGRRVKRGRVYRSGNMSRLTPEDCALLESLSITHILDYRDHHESAREENVKIRNAIYEICPAAPRSHAVAAGGADFFSEENLSRLPDDFMFGFYRQLPFNNAAYKRLFARLESLEQGALVHHCAVGKDRTGVGSALVLLALGVPVETVVEEYRQTEAGLHHFHVELLERLKGKISAQSLERVHHVTAANETFLHAAFDEILKRYTQFDAYFQAEYSLHGARLEALRDKYPSSLALMRRPQSSDKSNMKVGFYRILTSVWGVGFAFVSHAHAVETSALEKARANVYAKTLPILVNSTSVGADPATAPCPDEPEILKGHQLGYIALSGGFTLVVIDPKDLSTLILTDKKGFPTARTKIGGEPPYQIEQFFADLDTLLVSQTVNGVKKEYFIPMKKSGPSIGKDGLPASIVRTPGDRVTDVEGKMKFHSDGKTVTFVDENFVTHSLELSDLVPVEQMSAEDLGEVLDARDPSGITHASPWRIKTVQNTLAKHRTRLKKIYDQNGIKVWVEQVGGGILRYQYTESSAAGMRSRSSNIESPDPNP